VIGEKSAISLIDPLPVRQRPDQQSEAAQETCAPDRSFAAVASAISLAFSTLFPFV
jgi:hypothetical protein